MAALSPTLLAGAALDLAAAGLFAWVALRVRSRPAQSPGAARALGAFALWWWSAGAIAVLNGAAHALAAFGALDLALLATLRLAGLVPLCTGMAGVLAYFAFLLTGRAGAWKGAALTYGAWFPALVYAFVVSQPTRVVVGVWRVDLAFAAPPPPAVFAAIVALTVGPPMLAALASLRLLRTEQDPTRRYRLALVATAIGLWFGALMVARLSPDDAFQFAMRPVLGLGIAVLTVWAYDPPAVLRRALHVEALPRAPPALAAAPRAR